MSEPVAFQHDLPVMQVGGLGKIYARHSQDTKKKLGRAAWGAFWGFKPKRQQEVQGSQFWAVRDVSFQLSRGEALGIIGLNGSGKTTLLRMLAGQLPIDAGEIVVNGTSAAMIDLHAGFQSSASGYENIFLRAAALGFTRKQTQQHLDEIIAFSELGNAIKAPLATYSAGMRMRLAFSVMVIVSPDILLIDEVLAVGDFRFRQKCLAKVREMRERSAFVFVSHSMGDVTRFCDRVIVMHKGQARFEGPPEEAIAFYESLETGGNAQNENLRLASAMGPNFENLEAVSDVTSFWCDAEGKAVDEVAFNQSFALRVKFRSNINIRNLIVGVPVWATNSHYVTGLSTQISSPKFQARKDEMVELSLDVEGGYINPGTLKSMLTILDGPEHLIRLPNPDLVIRAAPHPTWGSVTVPHSWREVKPEAAEILPLSRNKSKAQ